jgi:hypothetical protein
VLNTKVSLSVLLDLIESSLNARKIFHNHEVSIDFNHDWISRAITNHQ